MSILLVYHSYSGQTRLIAEQFAQALNCDILALKPVIPFSNDYQAVVDEYQNNESDQKTVEIEAINVHLENYDTILIGTPVWWYTITPVIRSFLKKYDLKGKRVYPFATNAGWLGSTFQEMEDVCSGDVQEGLNITFSQDYHEHQCLTSKQELKRWIDKLK